MSQEQPRKPLPPAGTPLHEPIKYGDVFPVSGELATKPIAPADAAMMQAAETTLLGQTRKGGPAAAMQSAARRNENAGLVGHRDATEVAAQEGVSVAEVDLPGGRIVTETIGGQIIGAYAEATPVTGGKLQQSAKTIGEALEAMARSAGNKPVDHGDAAAIQAAECRATGSNVVTPGGLAATAQSAAAFNDGLIEDQDKIKLGDILTGARGKLAADRVATREDAEGIMMAEVRNEAGMKTHPGCVAESVAEAVRNNEKGT